MRSKLRWGHQQRTCSFPAWRPCCRYNCPLQLGHAQTRGTAVCLHHLYGSSASSSLFQRSWCNSQSVRERSRRQKPIFFKTRHQAQLYFPTVASRLCTGTCTPHQRVQSLPGKHRRVICELPKFWLASLLGYMCPPWWNVSSVHRVPALARVPLETETHDEAYDSVEENKWTFNLRGRNSPPKNKEVRLSWN